MRFPISAGIILALAFVAASAGGTECVPVSCADYGLDRSLVAWQEIDPQGRLYYEFTDTELELAGDTGWMLTNFGARIAAYDFSDPTAIRLLGLSNQALTGEHLVLDGNLAFVTGWGGLAIYDLASGSRARLLATYTYPGSLTRACRIGKFAFVHGIRSGVVHELLVFDVADPAAPILVRSATPLGASIHEHGDNLVAVGSWVMKTFSVTPDGNLVETASIALAGGIREILVSGDIAYVSTGDAVEAFDLAGASPVSLSTVTVRNINRLVAGDDRLYVADYLLGVLTYDVGDPGRPRLVSRIPGAVGIRDLAPCRGYLVATTDASVMQTLDTEGAGIPVTPPLIPLPASVIDGTGNGDDWIFATASAQGGSAWDLVCFDISNPMAPRETGRFRSPGRLDNPRRRGSYLVFDRLVVADVSDPAQPRVISPQQPGTHVALGDSLAYLAGPAGSDAVSIHDIRDLSRPALIGTASLGFDADALAEAEGVLLAADGNLIVSLNVTNPSAPTTLGAIKVPLGACRGLVVRDGFAYYLGEGGDVGIIDVSDPAQPRLRSVLQLPYRGTDGRLVVGNGVAYVHVRRSGIAVVDVADPDLPRLLGRIQVGDSASDAFVAIALSGDRLMALRAGEGFVFADRQCGDVAPRVVVDVVVEPRDRRHHVPCGGRAGGMIAAAVLSSAAFDAGRVDPSTVRFGPGDATPLAPPGQGRRHGGHGPRLVDVDCDGDEDLLLEFRVRDAAIACGDTMARLDGLTVDGTAICGQGHVSTRRPHGPREGAQDQTLIGDEGVGDCITGPDPGGTDADVDPTPSLAPNPFNPVTNVILDLGTAGDVSVRVYDLAGRLVAVPAAGPRPAGSQRIPWRGDDLDGRPVPSGTYFVHVEADGQQWTLRAALIR